MVYREEMITISQALAPSAKSLAERGPHVICEVQTEATFNYSPTAHLKGLKSFPLHTILSLLARITAAEILRAEKAGGSPDSRGTKEEGECDGHTGCSVELATRIS